MACIYENSKYYTKAVADAVDIIEPIGYKYFNESETKKITFKKKQGQLIYKFVVEKSLMRQISSRGTFNRQIGKFFNKSQAARKNFYLSGTNLDFVNKTLSPVIMNQLKRHFFSKEADQELLSFLELLGSLNTIQQTLLLIRDYALSTYFVYYHGENIKFYQYLDKALKQQFLQYESQILINSPKLSRPQLRKVDYQDKTEVQKYINEINQIGKQKDPLYNGVHLYICDFLPQLKDEYSIVNEQTQLWQFLQFNILVMISILGEGQHGILKIRGTYTHKTCEYIFLLKLAFNRVYLVKNIISNPFTNDKYIICQFFNKQNGKSIAEYLIRHYHVIFQKKAQILLIDPKLMFPQDFLVNITNFNDLSPIIKVTKDVLNDFMDNNNMEFYPNKEILLKKISQLKIANLQEIVSQIQKIVPNKQIKQKQKKDQIFQKQAVEFDFNLLDPTLKPDNRKDKTKAYCDLSLKKDPLNNAQIDRYLSRGDKNIQDKKDKSKKKKAEKQQE